VERCPRQDYEEEQFEGATAHLRQSIPLGTDGTEDEAVEAVIRSVPTADRDRTQRACRPGGGASATGGSRWWDAMTGGAATVD
jgi:hypothetical protein